MRRLAMVAVAVLAIAGCRGKSEPAGVAVSNSVEITDDQITRYIAWTRDWADLTKRHVDEMNVVSQKAAERYSNDFSKMSSDPELVAANDRQRAEMQDLMNRCPLNNAQMQAMKAVYAGILPKRDEARLSQARAKYGDKVVDRILARESELTANFLHQ